jgi:hypothetical protein
MYMPTTQDQRKRYDTLHPPQNAIVSKKEFHLT